MPQSRLQIAVSTAPEALTEEQKKAFSQNMGHENIATTFGSYGCGPIEEKRQIDIIQATDFTGKKQVEKFTENRDDIKEILRLLKDKEPKNIHSEK